LDEHGGKHGRQFVPLRQRRARRRFSISAFNVVPGDVNGDGVVTGLDGTAIRLNTGERPPRPAIRRMTT